MYKRKRIGLKKISLKNAYFDIPIGQTLDLNIVITHHIYGLTLCESFS